MGKRFTKRNETTGKWWTGKVRSPDVGERFRLVPFWDRRLAISDRTPLVIDPGPSFGAGDHPTTIMALELLEEAVSDKSRTGCAPTLLDVGTGTGVLAIAGKILGTGFTVALDIDPASVFTALRNAELNELHLPDARSGRSVEFVVGGVDCVKGLFQIVTVNLVAPLLLRLKEDLTDRVGDTLVLSGIADVMAEEVLTEFGSGDLSVWKTRSRDGWNAAVLHTDTRGAKHVNGA